MATKVDTIISANSEKMPMFTYIGLGGIVLNLITLFFIPAASGYSVNSLYVILSIITTACNGIAMFYIYDSLKKGMINLEQPCTSLSQFCSYGILAYAGLSIITSLMLFGANSLTGTGLFGTLAGLVGFVYFVLYIILGCKIMSNYEGKLKTLGIMMVAAPAVMILGVIIGLFAGGIGGVGTVGTIMAVIGAGISAYTFILAHELITGKSLF